MCLHRTVCTTSDDLLMLSPWRTWASAFPMHAYGAYPATLATCLPALCFVSLGMCRTIGQIVLEQVVADTVPLSVDNLHRLYRHMVSCFIVALSSTARDCTVYLLSRPQGLRGSVFSCPYLVTI